MLGFAIDYPYNIKLKKLKVKEKICIHRQYKYINSVSNSPKKKNKIKAATTKLNPNANNDI